MDFIDISYLTEGNDKQQLTHFILTEYKILDKLKAYSPILVGTIPIEIDIPSSDIDIICEVSDFNQFHRFIEQEFSQLKHFEYRFEKSHYVANFSINELPIEIYAENRPTKTQNAYLHMLVEYRLMQLMGVDFKKKIIDLKFQGYKTELAFGKLLGLSNPYIDLLNLNKLTDNEFIKTVTYK